MARNVYFTDKVRSEQNLYENIIVEALKMYGQDVYYLPRDLVGENRIFGEDVPSRFSSAHKIEMYIENVEGFEGEGDLFTRFGVEIRDEATFVVSKRRFENQVNRFDFDTDLIRPREGDLIYLSLSNSLFEIMHVEHEQPFYQLNNLPVYKMRCTLFEYNDEDLDTGVDAIDDIERRYAYQYVLQLATPRTAVLEAEILAGQVTNILITDGGANYSVNNPPEITVEPPPAIAARAESRLTGQTVSSLLLDSGGSLYITSPLVTIDAPTLPALSALAEADITDGVITQIRVTRGGRYYITNPTITINYKQLGSGYSVTRKFGNYSWQLTSSANNYDLVPNANSTTQQEASFWIRADNTTLTDVPIITFNDGTNTNSYGTYSDRAKIVFQLDSIGHPGLYINDTEYLMPSNSTDIRDEQWYHYRLYSRLDSFNADNILEIIFNQQSTSFTATTDAYVLFDSSNNPVINNGQNSRALVDDVLFKNYETYTQDLVTPIALAESDGDTLLLENFENPNTFSASRTTSSLVVEGQLSSVAIPDFGNALLDSAEVVVPAATGGPDNFKALYSANTANGVVTGFTQLSSGQFYENEPNVTISNPTGDPNQYVPNLIAIVDNTGSITSVTVDETGDFYKIPPTITVEAPPSAIPFEVGETAQQTLSSGTVISGEVASFNDSDSLLKLIHVGADDGIYHDFVSTLTITGTTSGATYIVDDTSEENTISQTEQNDIFSSETASFLDFSEDNPFGDPENN